MVSTFGINGDTKAGRNKATEMVDCVITLVSFCPCRWIVSLTYNHLLVDDVLALKVFVYEVGGDAHHDDGAGPLHAAGEHCKGAGNCC